MRSLSDTEYAMPSCGYRAWVNETASPQYGRTPPYQTRVVAQREKTKVRGPDTSSNNFD
jgi:hypothetical protein